MGSTPINYKEKKTVDRKNHHYECVILIKVGENSDLYHESWTRVPFWKRKWIFKQLNTFTWHICIYSEIWFKSYTENSGKKSKYVIFCSERVSDFEMNLRFEHKRYLSKWNTLVLNMSLRYEYWYIVFYMEILLDTSLLQI